MVADVDNCDKEVSFTPEYSNELLRFVQNVYEEYIKHSYTHLKLEKLLDLLEHTEYLFESYLEFLQEKDSQDALTAFTIGCYYLYLVVPQSIQFQTRNKSYSIFNDLKKMYENQANMTNVLLMVKDEVDGILDKSARDLNEFEKSITRKRAYSVPDRQLAKSLANLSISDNPIPEAVQETDPKPDHSNADVEKAPDEDTTELWTAPSLEPNDQLKLALDPEPLSPSLMALDQPLETDQSDATSFQKQPVSRLRQGSAPTKPGNHFAEELAPENPDSMVFFEQDGANENFWSANVDRQNTHRKDSYHSVYMFEGEGDDHSGSITDSLIQTLERLQKQSIITAPELFTILSSPEERGKLLLIDLRLTKRSRVNHIVAPYTVEVDPRDLWNTQTKTPISSSAVLDRIIKKPAFLERGSFEYIVYYTDMRTYMTVHFDYMFTLFYLLTSAPTVNLKSLPTHLLGGYEKWKKLMKNYSTNYNIELNDYIYRPYGELKKGALESSDKKSPEMPSWKPPGVPPRIRKRPPPPSSLSMPSEEGPLAPPPVPPKISLDHVGESESTLSEHGSTAGSGPSKSSKKLVRSTGVSSSNQQYWRLQRHYSIPTIEKSSNTYVSLSITGLRNLGNTCYINGMLQCLFATTKLRDLFISGKYETFLNQKFKNQPQLSKSFSILFKKMYINGGCSVVPSGFLKVLNYLRPDLRIPDDQQDTQEFLMLVLDRLHDELSNQALVADEYPDLLLYDQKRMNVQSKEYKKWFEEHVIGNGLAPIDHIFQGQIENTLECQRCGNSSYSHSTFYVLSLAMPKPSSSTFSRSKRVKLEDCINMFTSEETLSGENAWDCPKCCGPLNGPSDSKKSKKRKKLEYGGDSHSKRSIFKLHSKRSRSKSPFRMLGGTRSLMGDKKPKELTSKKTLNFIAVPPVLVIHLSRFYYDLTKKNDTIVTYPLILNIVLKNNEVAKYRLYGVVNHSGNLISGHYTSLVNKDPMHRLDKGWQKWYYFDDEVVKEETNHGNLEQGVIKVSSADVYVLFYERMDK